MCLPKWILSPHLWEYAAFKSIKPKIIKYYRNNKTKDIYYKSKNTNDKQAKCMLYIII